MAKPQFMQKFQRILRARDPGVAGVDCGIERPLRASSAPALPDHRLAAMRAAVYKRPTSF